MLSKLPTLLALTAACAAAHAKPNIVVIVSDDAGYADFGFTGSPPAPTPRIDSIAASGVTFTDGHVSASVCSPSRAGLLTGRYQQRFGHEFNLSAQDEDAGLGLPAEQVTLAETLKAAGYTTGAIGKWHLGATQGKTPRDQGFDHFDGLLAGSRSYFAMTDADLRHELTVDGQRYTEPDGFYVTDWIGARAAGFIEQNAGEPFFLYAAFTAPHTPMDALESDLASVDPELQGKRRTYAAMTASLDRNVGKILDAIDSAGVAGNTVVFFINDNGGATNNGSDNGPYRGMKGSKWEGGIRVPFSARIPGVAAPGSACDFPVISLDIYATAAALAGAEVTSQLDGLDLSPYLTGAQDGAPQRDLFWRRGVAAAVRSGDWKLIRCQGDPTLLFNLASDPSEQNNLAEAEPAITAELLAKLDAWEATLAEPGWREGKNWERNQVMKHRMDVLTRDQERELP